MKLFCGIDWAERHHDVAVVDGDGMLVAKLRIDDSAEGFGQLLGLLSEAGDSPDEPIPVAIETSRGLLVAALRGTGRAVYAINPMAVARYRDRHSMARKKSDHVDAMTLANILRTDAHAHRTLPADSDLARSITVLARAAQDAIWRRTKATQELRALLREYYPAFLAAFAGSSHTNLAMPDARAILAIAPTPAQGVRLTKTRIISALRKGGRQRRLEDTATRILEALRRPQLRQPLLVEKALGRQASALVVATGVSIDGSREVLGTAVGDSESFEFWREFLTSLKARGLSGVHLVISDAHSGLKAAIAQQFAGSAWQRCRVHFMRNIRATVGAKHVPPVMAAVKTIFAHTDPAEVVAQWDQVTDTFAGSFPKAAALMESAKYDVLAFTAFPKAHWQKVWSNNPIERLNKEIKRRADVVEIFPNPAAFLRLATAVVIEQHDEWQVTRRYVSDVSMDELRAVIAAKEHATEPVLALTGVDETA
ncbi:IS256 family transposase [Rhodococcus sp. HNM0563]|uniref:IS256 family transposase n=1 Tax=Rhodococcus sp. HNM0563 TaxID=2716339 RepID=UPI00146CCDAC|nr:IS256 family transposase [Rhodococcus sp. HNM0563]